MAASRFCFREQIAGQSQIPVVNFIVPFLARLTCIMKTRPSTGVRDRLSGQTVLGGNVKILLQQRFVIRVGVSVPFGQNTARSLCVEI